MWHSGHSLIKRKMREVDAMLGGEYTGHICFRDRWNGFDDALYCAARLLEVLGLEGRTLTELVNDLPRTVSTPELLVPVPEQDKFAIFDQIIDGVDFGDAKLITIDGLRAEFEDGWGLIRAASDKAALCFRFEADSEEALERIKGLYRNLLADVAPQLKPPF